MKVTLRAQIDHLQDVVPSRVVRWVNPEGIHLTLKFLGDVTANQLESIELAVQQAVRESNAFELRVTGCGCFPNCERPRTVWVGLVGENNTKALHDLRNRLEKAIAPLGYPTEKRAFNPHLTLGRVKSQNSQDVRTVGKVVQAHEMDELVKWMCDVVHVMQSTLKPTGAEYQSLASFPLGGENHK